MSERQLGDRNMTTKRHIQIPDQALLN